MTKLVFSVLLPFLFAGILFAQEKNQITYLANEGVLIEYEGKRVLIDALHKSDLKIYQFTQVAFRQNIIGKVAPFDQVDLFLVTHLHGDHFNPAMTIDFLEKHEESIMVAPNQVVGTMKNIAYLDGQIYRLNGTDKGLVYEMDGIKINALPLIHSYPQKNAWIENMAYLLDFEGLTVLHVGDAEFLPENLNRIQKAIGKGVDYVLLPDWYFEDEKTIAQVKQKIKAKKYMAMHVMVTVPGTYERRLKKRVKDFNMDLNVLMRVGEFQPLEK